MIRSRRRVFLLGSFVLAAGCGPDWDSLDPSLASGSTSSSGGMGGSGGATTSTSNTGGTGGCPGLDDGKDCTLDACDAHDHATHMPLAAGQPCAQDGGVMCDGKGKCVQCLMPADCPGTDAECSSRSCDMGKCGTKNTMSGKPLSMQTDGDCKKAVCDGNGGTTSLADNSDLPVDGKECTKDVCTAGVASNPPVTSGTACTENGGKMCDGAGACVECLMDTDCGVSTLCTAFTCTGGKCPQSPNLAPGTPCGTGMVCDGLGACEACQAPATAMFASSDVPKTIAGPNGSMISSVSVSGTTGSIVDVNLTVSVSGNVRAQDLGLKLFSPKGTSIALNTQEGGVTTGNFTGITFDDGAGTPAVRLVYASFVNAVPITSAIPDHALSAFLGEDPTGSWQLRVTDTGPGSSSANLLAWSLQIKTQAMNPGLTPVTVLNNTSQNIPHGGQVMSTIATSGLGSSVYKLTVDVQAPHPKSGQLSLALMAPGGQTIPLTTNIGGTTANLFSSTSFDDAAPLLLGCTSGTVCAPLTANIPLVVPMGSLSSLAGINPNGTWTLVASDNGASASTGALTAWSLTLTPTACPLGP